jgi:hypothetical protein
MPFTNRDTLLLADDSDKVSQQGLRPPWRHPVMVLSSAALSYGHDIRALTPVLQFFSLRSLSWTQILKRTS